MNAMTEQPAGRPEQTFFEDPAIDRLMGVVMALASEVWVLKDRVQAMEALLGEAGVLDREALAAEPGLDARAEAKAERDAFVRHLLDNLKGEQVTKGAAA